MTRFSFSQLGFKPNYIYVLKLTIYHELYETGTIMPEFFSKFWYRIRIRWYTIRCQNERPSIYTMFHKKDPVCFFS